MTPQKFIGNHHSVLLIFSSLPQKFIENHYSVLLIFSSLSSERGKIKTRSQFWIKRIQDLNDSFCVYVVQITFDCRVKEELGVQRDQIKMLSAPCSLEHLF